MNHTPTAEEQRRDKNMFTRKNGEDVFGRESLTAEITVGTVLFLFEPPPEVEA